jgi:hypothetical protein
MAKILNGYDLEKLETYVKAVESLHDEMETSKSKHMAYCKERREDIKTVKVAVKDAGLPLRQFEAVLKEREIERKRKLLRAAFNELEAETLDLFLEHLGVLSDTPLGGAALRAAGLMDDFADQDHAEA